MAIRLLCNATDAEKERLRGVPPPKPLADARSQIDQSSGTRVWRIESQCAHEVEAALLCGTRGGGVPDACPCNKTALLAPAMVSETDSCSSGRTQLFCGVGGTLHMNAQQKSD